MRARVTSHGIQLDAGTVITIAGRDCYDCIDAVTVRLTVAVDTRPMPTIEWVAVCGIVVRPGGVEGDEGSFIVRHAALVELADRLTNPDGSPPAASSDDREGSAGESPPPPTNER